MSIDIFGFFQRNERVPFSVNDQSGDDDFLNHLQTRLIDRFQGNPEGWDAQMSDDPDNARESTLNDNSIQFLEMMESQFQCRNASQRPSHDPEVAPKAFFTERFLRRLK